MTPTFVKLSKSFFVPVVFLFTLLLTSLTINASDFSATHSLFPDKQGKIAPFINFYKQQTGDIYIAIKIDAKEPLLYLSSTGLTTEPFAFATIDNFSGQYKLPEFDVSILPDGQYQFIHALVKTDKDFLDINNWVGGLSAIKKLNFSIGQFAKSVPDINNDGWADDDLNKDGFHDDDSDFDGFHDDDLNFDGFHDDDLDFDGFHDNDLDFDGYSDDDLDKNGFHDDDLDFDGFSDPNNTDGELIYRTNCSACHGNEASQNENGILEGYDISKIINAIAKNKGGMGFLSNLSLEDLTLTADYINSQK